MSFSKADYVSRDATGIADLLRTRQVSHEEVVECAMALAEDLNPKINAFVEIFDEPLAYERDSVFSGVPFAIKDLICHAAGKKNENGSRLSAGIVTDHDTDLMKRWRKAGCRTIGRTGSPEFGYCATTEPVSTGPVRNPWDLRRSAGGSSGGSGAAVAAGIVPFAHGNDGGGSIRIPAACNGLVGLKTSRGRVPVGPDIGEAVNGVAVEFALTRSIRDCAALLDAVHGPALGDPFQIQAPARRYIESCRSPLKPVRIALMTDPWSRVPVDGDMIEGADIAAQLCESLGHEIEVCAPPLNYEAFIEATHTIWVTCVHHIVKSVAEKTGRKPSADNLEATTLRCFIEGGEIKAGALQAAFGVVNEVTRSFAQFFQSKDVLITPTTATPAPLLGTLNANDSSATARQWTERIFTFAPFTAAFNMTGQPALSLPLHRTAEGLPVGVQFAGRFGEEHTLLQLGRQLEEIAPWPAVAPLWASV